MTNAKPGRIVVFGSNGQLGTALRASLTGSVEWLTRADADFSKPDTIVSALERIRPTIVINAAADTKVDRAETEEAQAHIVNALSPEAMARWCARAGAAFFHFSTDFIFGHGEAAAHPHPRLETDPTEPLNAYGRTKLEGERRVLASGARACVFRLQWVFGPGNTTFPATMLRLAAERETLEVVDDQYGAPSFAPHLARAVSGILDQALARPEFPGGLYHLCPDEAMSRHAFALEIFQQARARGQSLKVRTVTPIPSEKFKTPALRPKYVALDTTKVKSTFSVQLPSWREGVREWLAQHASTEHSLK
ncbi:MAG: dTDP-4-dehydrorhamnose reductase [Bdellovibrionaceae bacterium]|nr:dTDP-4-dehydrorhamnose reductase [Pseudobdellovibrionaceae bacterium]